MRIRVGIIFGGPSVEHEVSVISGVQAIKNIDETKYEAIPIYITKDRQWYTGQLLADISNYKDLALIERYATKVNLVNRNGQFVLEAADHLFRRTVATIDVAFPIVHGHGVEDGSLAGFLSMVGVPTVGPNTLGATLAQDKVVMKQVYEAMGLPIVNYMWFYDSEYLGHRTQIFKDVKKMGYPVVVKPATLGSSVGIQYVNDETALDQAINEAISYDNKIIIEQAIHNLLEVNCSVIGDYEFQEASVIEEVITNHSFLTYADKYEGSSKTKGSKGMASASRIIPARLSEKMTSDIQDLAKLAFKATNLTGVARVDFLIDSKTKAVYVNEVNSIPGSLSFYLWTPTGKSYTELLDEVISLGIKNYKNNNRKINSFASNLLTHYQKNGVKGAKGIKK